MTTMQDGSQPGSRSRTIESLPLEQPKAKSPPPAAALSGQYCFQVFQEVGAPHLSRERIGSSSAAGERVVRWCGRVVRGASGNTTPSACRCSNTLQIRKNISRVCG
jgi:hypothetical protein